MLEKRVLSTLKFYGLQGLPLTLFEVYQYLLADEDLLRHKIDENFELIDLPEKTSGLSVRLDTLLRTLQTLQGENQVHSSDGFYFLPHQHNLVAERIKNIFNGLVREKRIRRFIKVVAHIPFVRGVSLGGSQALGQQRPTSDIDLLVITHTRFMWLCRTLMSVYFQILGMRRHGNKIANRFCLNHYFSNIREVDAERNLYKAMEYTRLRPLIYPEILNLFQTKNQDWINVFMPNFRPHNYRAHKQSLVQKFLELLLNNRFGLWLEDKLKAWQSARIRQDQFVFIRTDELSFHPESKHEQLLAKFFE